MSRGVVANSQLPGGGEGYCAANSDTQTFAHQTIAILPAVWLAQLTRAFPRREVAAALLESALVMGFYFMPKLLRQRCREKQLRIPSFLPALRHSGLFKRIAR